MQTHLPRAESTGWGRGCHQSPFASSPCPPPPRPLREGGCRRDRARTLPPLGSRHPRPAEPGNRDRNLPGKTRSWAAERPNLAPSRVPAVPWGPSAARRALWTRPGRLRAPLRAPLPAPPALRAAGGDVPPPSGRRAGSHPTLLLLPLLPGRPQALPRTRGPPESGLQPHSFP